MALHVDNSLAQCLATDIAAVPGTFQADAAFRDSLEYLRMSDPGAFSRAAVQVLVSSEPSARWRYLLTVLAQSDLLMAPLSDPRVCTLEQAMMVAKVAARITPESAGRGEVFLSRLVAREPTPELGLRIIQTLEILSAMGAKSCWTTLRHELLTFPDEAVRAKAALLIVRNTRSANLAAKLLLDPNPQVQASVVEGLWTFEHAEALPLLNAAATSQNSRVAANAALGLYHGADLAGVSRLLEMLEREDEHFQMSAAWAIGETKDPRFVPALERTYRRSAAAVRFSLARALSSIRRRSQEQMPLEPVVFDAIAAPDGTRTLTFAVRPSEGFAPSTVRLIDVAFWEDGELIREYSLTPPREKQKLLLGVIAPRVISASDPRQHAVRDCIERCLPLLRRGDSCRIDRYAAELPHPDDKTTASSPFPYEESVMTPHLKQHWGFLFEPAVLRRIVETPGPRECAARDVFASLLRTIEAAKKLGGERLVFLLLQSGMDVPELSDKQREEFLEDVRLFGLAIHGISETNAPWYSDLCTRSPEGSFAVLPPERWGDRVERVYLDTLGGFRAVYARVGPVSSVVQGKLVISTESAGGSAPFELRSVCETGAPLASAGSGVRP